MCYICRVIEGSGDPSGITFNPVDKASFITLSKDRRTATCSKGYRMVKATAGVNSGTWYCEFTIPTDPRPGTHYRYVNIC